MRSALLALTFCLVGCAPRREATNASFTTAGTFGERASVLTLSPGVTATIVAPARLDPRQRVDLILYALPNGNTTAQTIGRPVTDSADWRYDIQNIGAQTRALRERGLTHAVVAYLEADTRSWPEWRRRLGYDHANARIVEIVNELRAAIGNPADLAVTLTGHSGGGSLAWGFLDGQESLPDWLARVAFLDSNYSFEPRHGAKLGAWLRGDAARRLVVLAYDDREIRVDGRKVVSDSGGTWRATHRMMEAMRGEDGFAQDTLGEFHRYRAPQMEFLLHPNPGNRILHTVMIGEMNGYMHALLTGRRDYDRGPTVLRTERAYCRWAEGAGSGQPGCP